MADEHDPAQPPGGGLPQPPSSALEDLKDRVARLELALAALQQELAPRGAAQSPPQAAPAPIPASRLPLSAERPAPPPPPIPQASPARTAIPPPAFKSSTRPDESAASFESRLGSQIFNRIAIVSLLMSAAWGLKLAVDRGYIGPMARVVVGLVAGAALVLWSERFRAKGFAAFSYSLKAVGSGVLYLTLWAAFHLYHVLPASAALCLMILVTAWNAFMAWAQDSELLAVYAIAGGFATPILLSTGGNHEVFLFTYILAIDLATVALVRLRGWPRLLLGAFPFTVIYYTGWYGEFYGIDALGVTSVFIALFGLTFATVPLGPRVADSATAAVRAIKRSTLLEDILLPLANAAFVALAYYAVLQDADHHDWLPWLMIALAALYLALMRAPQTRTASAIHLSLAVVFLTIAIPLKASGHWITVSWLVEGLALMWVSARLAQPQPALDASDPATAHASRVLRPLAAASLALGFAGVCTHALGLLDFSSLSFWNKGTGTALTGIAVFAAVAWLALRTTAATRAEGPSVERASLLNWPSIAVGSFLLIDITAALLTLRELGFSWQWDYAHPAFRSADFLTALLGLAVFAAVVAVSRRLAHAHPAEEFWLNCAALSTIAFNLVAVLTGVREVSAAFAPPSGAWNADAALQQALAISAWLMLYGALLLAAGFLRRSGFLRWQALVLLVITIFKAFLYDMRSLSQGYRVVSFLALGALLMAISFAYQKDWLNLRGAELTADATPYPDAATDPDSDGGAAQ
jgi:uncharacterized membrane protein